MSKLKEATHRNIAHKDAGIKVTSLKENKAIKTKGVFYMKYSRKWEDVGDSIHRLKVHGGWLIRSWDPTNMTNQAVCYVPDPSHTWELEN